MVLLDIAGLEGQWDWQVGGERPVDLPPVESCCCCALGAVGYGAPASLSWSAFASGSQRPSCLCWVRFAWQCLVSFLLSFDLWVSDDCWHLLWTNSPPSPWVPFYFLESVSSLPLPLSFSLWSEKTQHCFISCGTTVRVPTLGLDGWTKVFLAL